MKVLVLGATGMLGSMVTRELLRDPSYEVTATALSRELLEATRPVLAGARWRLLDAATASVDETADVLGDAEWVVNAIGIIKAHIRDCHAAEVERAVRVNALFPHVLAQAAIRTGARVIQIATDCVYSGVRGAYSEEHPHDPLDVYGKTKSLGEVWSDHFYHLRCSIIGPELHVHKSLLDWFLLQPPKARVKGYTNHLWNGVTTLHFARLCRGLIGDLPPLPHVQHVVPQNTLSKYAMLIEFAGAFNREDITIEPAETPVAVDRTLSTINPEANAALWRAAGYDTPPTIEKMIAELARQGKLGKSEDSCKVQGRS